MQSSLHPNCHYQITYAKFNLKIYYPPPSEDEIWHYEKTNADHIRKSIDEFSRERYFGNTSVNNKVHMFNKTVKNIMSNHIPHKTIICNDRDPPWTNKDFKQLILDQNHAYKSSICNDKSLQFFNQLQFYQTKLNPLIEESKNQYYTCLSKTSQRLYWSILKTFLKNKKIDWILRRLHQDKFVTDFKEKVINLFAYQRSIVRNKSELPANLTKRTCKSPSTLNISTDDILKITRNLDPNKPHRHFAISIRMTKNMWYFYLQTSKINLSIMFRNVILSFISIISQSNKFPSQKHLGMTLDAKLNFQEHLKNILNKVNKKNLQTKLSTVTTILE